MASQRLAIDELFIIEEEADGFACTGADTGQYQRMPITVVNEHGRFICGEKRSGLVINFDYQALQCLIKFDLHCQRIGEGRCLRPRKYP